MTRSEQFSKVTGYALDNHGLSRALRASRLQYSVIGTSALAELRQHRPDTLPLLPQLNSPRRLAKLDGLHHITRVTLEPESLERARRLCGTGTRTAIATGGRVWFCRRSRVGSPDPPLSGPACCCSFHCRSLIIRVTHGHQIEPRPSASCDASCSRRRDFESEGCQLPRSLPPTHSLAATLSRRRAAAHSAVASTQELKARRESLYCRDDTALVMRWRRSVVAQAIAAHVIRALRSSFLTAAPNARTIFLL